MSELSEVLYGKTAQVTLADKKEYVLREPSIDTLESMDFGLDKLDEIKNLKKLVWFLLKDDNKDLTEKQAGRLITFSMLQEGSPFMKAVLSVIGREASGSPKD